MATSTMVGVQAVWVVNPRCRRTSMVDHGALIPVDEWRVPGTEIRIAVAELNALQAQNG